MRWRIGEPLYLDATVEATAKEVQESHREVSVREGIVLDFLERRVPSDWNNWPLDKRRMFWGGVAQGDIELIPRDRVCALEVWCEVFNGLQKDMKYTDTVELNGILENAPGWVRSKNGLRCGQYGLQRGFIRR